MTSENLRFEISRFSSSVSISNLRDSVAATTTTTRRDGGRWAGLGTAWRSANLKDAFWRQFQTLDFFLGDQYRKNFRTCNFWDAIGNYKYWPVAKSLTKSNYSTVKLRTLIGSNITSNIQFSADYLGYFIICWWHRFLFKNSIKYLRHPFWKGL